MAARLTLAGLLKAFAAAEQQAKNSQTADCHCGAQF
jgi:hypothetical protein